METPCLKIWVYLRFLNLKNVICLGGTHDAQSFHQLFTYAFTFLQKDLLAFS